MPELRYALLADGASDRALMPHLTWLLQQRLPSYAIQAEMAELWTLPPSKRPKGLTERIKKTLELYRCDLLFIHRDAEREARQVRVGEIRNALTEAAQVALPPTICVIPVRMQEAWLLFDENAIRYAAENPNGKMPLLLPPLSGIENRPDPKQDLHEVLRTASGLRSHRLRSFSESKASYRVSEYTDDFAPLRVVSAFRALEADVDEEARRQGW